MVLFEAHEIPVFISPYSRQALRPAFQNFEARFLPRRFQTLMAGSLWPSAWPHPIKAVSQPADYYGNPISRLIKERAGSPKYSRPKRKSTKKYLFSALQKNLRIQKAQNQLKKFAAASAPKCQKPNPFAVLCFLSKRSFAASAGASARKRRNLLEFVLLTVASAPP